MIKENLEAKVNELEKALNEISKLQSSHRFNDDVFKSIDKLIEDVSNINNKYINRLATLDNVQKDVDTAKQKANDLISEFKGFMQEVRSSINSCHKSVISSKKEVAELEKTAKTISKKIDEQAKKVKSFSQIIKQIEENKKEIDLFMSKQKSLETAQIKSATLITECNKKVNKSKIEIENVEKLYTDFINCDAYKLLQEYVENKEKFLENIVKYIIQNIVVEDNRMFSNKTLPLKYKKQP